MPSAVDQPRVVHSHIGYWSGYTIDYQSGSVAQYRTNPNMVANDVHDLRGEDFSLDVQGFELVESPRYDINYDDAEQIRSTVYPGAERTVQQATGASKVHCYSHLVRKHAPEMAQALANDPSVPDTQNTGLSVPSPRVHIDHSYDGSHQILKQNLPTEEVAKIKQGGRRWAIINLWKPIKPIYRDPLCLCDARTVDPEDLVEQTTNLPPKGTGNFEGVSKGRSFKSFSVAANPKHKWYYASAMQPTEAMLIKIYDTEEGVARGSPHTSFTIPGTEHLEARNSVEFRCLVFYDS